MKKLMVIATVALAAVSLNAATIKWSASGIKDDAGTAVKGGDVMFYAFFTDVTDASGAVPTVTDAAAAAALIAKGDKSAVAASGKTNGLGSLNLTTADAIGSLFGSGSAFDGIIIAMNADNTKFLDLGEKHIDVENGSSTYTVAFGAINNVAGDWQTVPEPTSGLLLLLGVAGLALRRRRA